LWDGTGEVDASGSNVASCSSNGTTNSAVALFDVDPDSTNGITIRILSSNSTDPVTNVRVVPVAFEATYNDLIFHPSFLAKVQEFDHIRFTGWQKSNNALTFDTRTLPSAATQHATGGVALEHMADLVRLSGIKSVWFSLPLSSEAYNAQAAVLLASILPAETTVYYEAGSPDTNGDSNRAAEFDLLHASFTEAFSSQAAQAKLFSLVPSASVSHHEYVPHLISWYGATRMAQLGSVAVLASFGKADKPWNVYSSHGHWSIEVANYTISELFVELRESVLITESIINIMRQRLLAVNPSLQFVAHTAGPVFSPNNYGYRAGRGSINYCESHDSFPCVWANAQWNFANQSELDAARPMIDFNCSQEAILEEKLIEVQRSDEMYDLYLDFLRRWEALGGNLLTGSLLVQPAMLCPSGGKGCGSAGMYESPMFDACGACAKYSSVVDYHNGVRSSLPYSGSDVEFPWPHNCSATGCVWGTCVTDECRCFDGYSGEDCSVLVPSTKHTDCVDDVGMNLAGVVDWSPEYSYVDIFKASRAWISQDFYPGTEWSTDTEQFLSLSDYPTRLLPNQALGALMVRDLREHVPGGIYVLLYDGDGIFTFGLHDISYLKREVGRIEVGFAPSSGLNNGIFVRVERTNPLDPIRNIRLYMPGFEQAPMPFHPLFLESIRNYKVLRFMDMSNTNAAEYAEWELRSTNDGETRSYSGASSMNGTGHPGAGVPIEDQVLLCNMMGADPWFNVPHLANDDFVRREAQLVYATLRPDVKVYVEYSNEVWGTLFPGGQYAQEQGLLSGLSTDATMARFCFYVKRSSEIFAIWKEEFGTDADRLEFVYASQSVNPHVTQLMLECSVSVGVEVNATAIAIAPYFGHYDTTRDTDLDIFMNTTLPAQIEAERETILGHKELATAAGMRLVTYEAGQGLLGTMTGAAADDMSVRANRDVRMTQLYETHFNLMREAGVELMMHFTSTGFHNTRNSFGLKESLDQNPLTAPKYVGLLNYITSHSSCDVEAFSTQNETARCSYNGIFLDGQCMCYYGAEGDQCQTTVFTEHVDLCGYFCYFHQGVCVPDYVEGYERYWKCECDPGYYGYQCHLFDCQDKCNHNGKCLDIDICSCYPGFQGEFCEVDCGCGGHGICQNASLVANGATCACDVGYEWSVGNNMCVPQCSGGDSTGGCVSPGVTAAAANATCKYGARIEGVCTCHAGVSGVHCDELVGAPSNQKSMAGVNLAGISYWNHEWSFVDAMKGSSHWFSQNFPLLELIEGAAFDNDTPLILRPDGYPASLADNQIVTKLMLRDVHLHAPAGRYVCLYDGDGEIDFMFDARVVAYGKNRIEFIFTPTVNLGCEEAYCGDNGIYMRILKTNPENPIHNVRVLMPGFEHTHEEQPFHPWFLDNIRPYSTIRFMDWMETNNNDHQVDWADRTLPSFDRQENGVALEYMVKLCNTVASSPWFNIPHRATDGYVRNFAEIVRDSLREDVKVYVEYSNEVWNCLFSQCKYAQDQGYILGLASNNGTAGHRFYSQRSVEIFAIWKDVFKDSPIQLKFVLSTQVVSPSITNEILSWKNASEHADFVGVGAYFDCGGLGSSSNAPITAATMDVDDVLNACSEAMAMDVVAPLTNLAGIAEEHGVELITYEAGQALVEYAVMAYGAGETAGLTELFKAANRHPRMKEVYGEYIDALTGANAVASDRPVMFFGSCGYYTKYGSWGTIEYTGQPVSQAPKYAAVLENLVSPHPECLQSTTNVMFPQDVFKSRGGSYVGYPAVLSPDVGDVWIAGNTQVISWLTDGVSTTNSPLISIYLHEVQASCEQGGGAAVVEIATNVPLSMGFFQTTLCTAMLFDSSSYYIELRGESSSNYTSLFSIQSPHFFENPSSTLCCGGSEYHDMTTCMDSNRVDFTGGHHANSHWEQASSLALEDCPLDGVNGYPVLDCRYDEYGCRDMRTPREGDVYGNFKPVTDCVAQLPLARKTAPDHVSWDAGRDASPTQQPNLQFCDSLVHLYPASDPDSCSIEGAEDSQCPIWLNILDDHTTTHRIDLTTLTSSTGRLVRGSATCSGASVGFLSDINGDGFADTIVGGCGSAFHVLFGTGGASHKTVHLQTMSLSSGFSIADLSNSQSPVVFSALGDINSDGFGDYIAGITSKDNSAGAAYVIYGTSKSQADNIDLSVVRRVASKIHGAVAGDLCGYSVASAGDTDGDGHAESIIGAPGSSPYGRAAAGAAFVVYSKNYNTQNIRSGDMYLSEMGREQGFRVAGAVANQRLGEVVRHAGDINGDGIADFIVSSLGQQDSPGAARNPVHIYVVYGRAVLRDDLDLALLSPSDGFRIVVPAELVSIDASISIASTGDINDDGFGDIVIGGVTAQTSWVLFGSNSSDNVDVSALTPSQGFVLKAAARRLGISLDGVGDFNGDGISDIVIGAPKDVHCSSVDASAFIVFGRQSGFMDMDLDNMAQNHGIRIFMSRRKALLLGVAVSSAGDVNGDGLDDVIIGAPAPVDAVRSGLSFIVYGNRK